ncbi:MAG: methyltransferase domain-containing protein [Bacteroidetes bacterium]|nr:MAG: methyltransferase domain-containing protein [Bacteroidota bacterium]
MINIQGNLFEEEHYLTIQQVAELCHVSEATIRNWIKTGYLKLINNKYIDKQTTEIFLTNILGKEKLIARANKIKKQEFNYEQVKRSLLDQIINCNNPDSLSKDYENALSESYRNKEGIYYTPPEIVSDMLNYPLKNNILTDVSSLTFLDPCCGSGNFLIEALKLGFRPENIYGFDTDPVAVEIAKSRIKKLYHTECNIQVKDFLKEAIILHRSNIKYDWIFTNPPWGKKLTYYSKQYYASIYQTGKSTDTTSLFMAASLQLLKPNGILGFLIQEAFFNIGTFEDIRNKILDKKIINITDYGKAFDNILTRTQSILLQNTETNGDHTIKCYFQNQVSKRKQQTFQSNPKKIFNFYANEQDERIIHHLYKIPHITLKDRCEWALGIVTGNNTKFCSKEPKENWLPIYKGSDITKKGLKKPSLYFNKSDLPKFQQVAPIHLYEANEKIIYRFITTKLCFYYDTHQSYILNSANLFIPKNISISMQQLTDLLNSEIINWLFQKLYFTHKVLRSDLETLPIHIEYFNHHKNFSEKTYLEYLHIEKSNGTYRIKE